LKICSRVEDLLELRDVALGLLQMPLKPFAKVRILNLIDELWQHLAGQILLDVQNVAELVQEKIPRRSDVWHVPLLGSIDFDLVTPCPCKRVPSAAKLGQAEALSVLTSPGERACEKLVAWAREA
jgi:hypothetical protein